MSRKLTAEEWLQFEALVRSFCEIRGEYRRRKEAGTLGEALEQRMIQTLNEMDLQIERIKSGNEIELHRAKQPAKRSGRALWRTA